MFKKLFLLLAGLLLAGGFYLSSAVNAAAAEQLIKLMVNGREVAGAGPVMIGGRVFVPIRIAAEGLGVQVEWDQAKKAVTIKKEGAGDRYLKGKNFSGEPDIGNDLIKAGDLKNLLDDDGDKDIADYREGHNGGDQITNDPLVVDIRSKADYDAAHIPGAFWVSSAASIAEKENINKLLSMLDTHVAKGGKKEIVLYCYTGSTSGLAAGVLGAQGLPVKNMCFGFDIAWRGTKVVDPPILAPMENNGGKTIQCGT